ncbi:hypothetical protein BU52_10700 [Streptomyces toyocaensis]|uniref:Uncharacterized protein n=1 Tax=Streptomyces toyocaensis TaxID=55952 RepID=A0A081XU35_STRTO|nr:hypothetical protein BU52_10700 [Streptomyces toyocaensis]
MNVRLISAPAYQGRFRSRWIDVKVHATKGHGHPDADTTDALDALPGALDAITGHEVKGFGWVSGGALAGSHAIREGLALSVRLDIETGAQRFPDPRFALDERALTTTHDPEEVAA